ERPTAIVCYNDELAVMLMDVIREQKLVIPENISIVGFDDSFLSNISGIKLTTVKHPKIRLGHKAAEVILNLVEESKKGNLMNKINKGSSIVFETELMVRSSMKRINVKKGTL